MATSCASCTPDTVARLGVSPAPNEVTTSTVSFSQFDTTTVVPSGVTATSWGRTPPLNEIECTRAKLCVSITYSDAEKRSPPTAKASDPSGESARASRS